MADWNTGIIEEFRANGGQVGGMFEGVPLLILEHKGARTGTVRHSPLTYQSVGDAYAIFASKAGAADNPDWYHNLRAHPETQVEVGTETVNVTARMVDDNERDPIWAKQKAASSMFGEYEEKTDRVIPVVMLDPR